MSVATKGGEGAQWLHKPCTSLAYREGVRSIRQGNGLGKSRIAPDNYGPYKRELP